MTSLRLILTVALLLPGVVRMPAQSVTPEDTVIDSVQFDWRSTDTETIAVFSGQVVVSGTNLRLTCDRLEIIATRKGDPADAIGKIDDFKSLVATGNVRIIQGDREAACGRAEILPGDDKILLTGQPVVVDHSVNWTWTGDELEILRGERQIRGKNVHFTGPPIKNLGVEKVLPPVAAPEKAPDEQP